MDVGQEAGHAIAGVFWHERRTQPGRCGDSATTAWQTKRLHSTSCETPTSCAGSLSRRIERRGGMAILNVAAIPTFPSDTRSTSWSNRRAARRHAEIRTAVARVRDRAFLVAWADFSAMGTSAWMLNGKPLPLLSP